MNVLNPPLYQLMRRLFGDVGVSAEGCPLIYRVVINPINGEKVPELEVGSEHYTAVCPVCGYNKHHTLYVSHAFGRELPEFPGRKMEHLVNCFYCHAENRREEFEITDSAGKRRRAFMSPLAYYLRDYTNDIASGRVLPQVTYSPGTKLNSIPVIPPPPGIPVHKLRPGHPALEYLTQVRNQPIDPQYLGEVYNIRWTDWVDRPTDEDDVIGWSHYKARKRLIVPVAKDQKVVGWQGRVINADDHRPRWYFPPGPRRAKTRNWDTAKAFRGCILVEGFFDEVAAGPSAMTIFGKSLNFGACYDIAKQWDFVVVALDPVEHQELVVEANGVERAGAAATIVERLQAAGVKRVQAIRYQPGDSDPSDLGPALFNKRLKESVDADILAAVAALR